MKTINKKVFGVITARGGSKGIPRKNIKLCAGKPLIYYTIKAAQASQLLDYFLVSTDDQEIAQISRSFGADVPFLRPAELATDESKSLSVAQHALEWAEKNKNCQFDYVLILQPTNPLRISEDIDKSIELAERHPEATSVVSVCDLGIPAQKIKKIVNNQLIDQAKPEIEGTRRQDYSEEDRVYKKDGAIYLIKRETMLGGSLFGKKIIPYLMPPERAISIDNPLDFQIAQCLLLSFEE